MVWWVHLEMINRVALNLIPLRKIYMISFKPAIPLIAGVLFLVMAGCASNKPITVKSTNTIRGKITAIERGTKTITVQSNQGEPVAVQINNLTYDPDMVLVGKNVEIQLQRTYSLTFDNPENALQPKNSPEKNATVERINFKEKRVVPQAV